MTPPVMVVNVNAVNKQIMGVYTVAALPDGTCLAHNQTSDYQREVLRINQSGQTVPPLHLCKDNNVIKGIIHSKGIIYIIQAKGIITKCLLSDLSSSVETYCLDVGLLYNGDIVDDNTLILTDGKRGEVFTYSLNNRHKDVKIKGLSFPVSVAYGRGQHGNMHAVCEQGAGLISLYDEEFNRMRSISSTEDGQLDQPWSAIFSPWGSILVADTHNDRVSEFSKDGAFIQHLLSDISRPMSISYIHPYLWVAGYGGIFKLFKLLHD